MTLTRPIFPIPRPERFLRAMAVQLRPPEIAHDTVAHILHQYGLAPAGRPRNLTTAKRNRNLVVQTTAGRKVLKRYWPGWPASFVVHEHSILQRLATLNFPAPRLVATPAGHTFITHQEEQYALFDYERGRNYSAHFLLRPQRLRLMALAGRTLANLHQQLAGFVPAGRHYTGFQSNGGERWRDLAWHVAKVRELREKSGQLSGAEEGACARWLSDHSDEVLAELGQLDALLRPAGLPRLIIHGDYGLHNLHFHKDGRVTPLDFESARLEWRLRDLVNCLGRLRYDSSEFDVQSICHFMAAYQAIYPLHAVEWQWLPQVWRFCKLEDAVKYWNSYFETAGPARKLFSARKAVQQAEQDVPQVQALVAVLQEA